MADPKPSDRIDKKLEVQARIRQQMRDEWVEKCTLDGMTPQEAAENMGVPLELFGSIAATDPTVNRILKEKHDGPVYSRKAKSLTAMDIKAQFLNDVFVKARFGEKISSMIQAIDPETEEGTKTILALMKNGLIRDTLPKETAAQVQTQEVPWKVDLNQMNSEQKVDMLEQLLDKTKGFLEERYRAQQTIDRSQVTGPKRDEEGAGDKSE